MVLVALFTAVTNGIYLPIWFLVRREELNGLHSREKLGKGIQVFGIASLAVITLLGCSSDVLAGIGLGGGGSEMGLAFNFVDLITSILALLVVLPFVQQTLKVRRMLDEHYNGYMKRNIKFSSFYSLLFLNIYLQYKINRLDRLEAGETP